MVENPCGITFVPIKQLQTIMAVVGTHQLSSFIHDCNIDMKSRHGCAEIDRITVIDNDMIVLCDNTESRLLVYKDNNQYQYQIKTKYNQSDITTIPGTNTVVVSSDNSEYIQFIDIVKKEVYNEIHIPGSQHGGMAASNTNLFVGSKGLVHVLDHQGHPIRKIKTKKEDRTLLYITLCSHGNIWYSDFFSLYCIKLDGKEVFTYITSPDLRGIVCITTDNHGNVYIVGYNSYNIHRFRSDGTFIDIILSKEHNIRCPRTCCFNRNYTKLYVSNNAGTVLSVFNVV